MRKATGIVLLAFALALAFGAGSAFAASQSKLEEAVKPLIGVKYRYGGTTPEGFDCSGFVRYVYKQLGIELPRSSREMIKIGRKVAKDELRPGDLVFFNTNGKSVSHVGIYMGNNKFVHSSTSKGVVYTSLDSEYYAKRYVGARRILDFETFKKIAAAPETDKEGETDGLAAGEDKEAAKASPAEAAAEANGNETAGKEQTAAANEAAVDEAAEATTADA